MKRKADWMDVGFAIFATLVVLFIIYSLTSCQTAKNLPRHNDKFPLAAAQYAHKKFPPIESHTVDTLTNSDTLYQPGPAIDTTVFAIHFLSQKRFQLNARHRHTSAIPCAYMPQTGCWMVPPRRNWN
jgi:hypothetical protein